MRMAELKSLARECRLRGYSRMRKTELVAFFDHLGKNYSPLCEAKPGPLIKLAGYFNLRWGIKYCQ